MSKFTPGKWEVDGFGQAISVFDEREEATLFIVDHVYSWANRDGEAEANARLIAAAPEMYERLKLLARLLTRQAQNQLQDNIDPAIADSIYELLAKIDDEPVESMKYSSSFFQNRNCEYFPCHNVKDTERFSCLFCFCPLYHKENYGGKYRILSNGVKDCFGCTLPHLRYDYVISMLKETKHE